MHRINPFQINAFAVSAKEKSFSRAAAQLGVTQSSVTQHVAKLEQEVGARLFLRKRSGLELTPTGRELNKVADRWLIAQQLVQERIENYSTLDSGHLRITATAPRPALPLIAAFLKRFPNVTVDFSLQNWSHNMTLLKERNVDIAVVTNPKLSTDLYSQELRKSTYCALLPRNHLLAKKSKVSLADLAKDTLIIPEDGSLTQTILNKHAHELGIQLGRTTKMATFAVVKEAILHGIGVGIMLENSVHETERLVERKILEIDASFSDCVVIPAEKQSLRLIQSFLSVVDAQSTV